MLLSEVALSLAPRSEAATSGGVPLNEMPAPRGAVLSAASELDANSQR
jgi:hypothetical protein